MGRKITFVVGAGVGYVLGARAGRQRYETIVRTAQRLREHPTVQSTAGVLQAQAGSVVHNVKGRIGAGHRPGEESRWWEYSDSSAGERAEQQS